MLNLNARYTIRTYLPVKTSMLRPKQIFVFLQRKIILLYFRQVQPKKIVVIIVFIGTCPDVSACSAWIGANDIDFEGVFRWTRQNRLVILPFWGALQPNDILSPLMEDDCVLMSQGGFWDDISCADANNFICEK